MKYEWDEIKNQRNFAKHGLRFEDAALVFPGLALRLRTTVSIMEKNGL
jgi:uncharacterized DUF497 family protein